MRSSPTTIFMRRCAFITEPRATAERFPKPRRAMVSASHGQPIFAGNVFPQDVSEARSGKSNSDAFIRYDVEHEKEGEQWLDFTGAEF